MGSINNINRSTPRGVPRPPRVFLLFTFSAKSNVLNQLATHCNALVVTNIIHCFCSEPKQFYQGIFLSIISQHPPSNKTTFIIR